MVCRGPRMGQGSFRSIVGLAAGSTSSETMTNPGKSLCSAKQQHQKLLDVMQPMPEQTKRMVLHIAS